MELNYPYVLIACAVIAVALIVWAFLPSKFHFHFHGGKKITTPSYLLEDPYYKKKVFWYKFLSKACAILASACLVLCGWIGARPYTYKVEVQDKYCRDIILCMDVSTSVDELNERLVSKLKNMVSELKGERFGIVIFNTSPVLLVPLTDDYDFVMEQLDTIEKALQTRSKYLYFDFLNTDSYYYLEYISAGTDVGYEQRGSSLIGDGLASCVNNFSQIEKDRPRIVIFSTDNELAGTPILTLPEAAQICSLRNTTVYGIGTRLMNSANRQEMKEAVESTGGEFFVEESGSAFDRIVNRISTDSEGVATATKVFHKIDVGEEIVIILLITLAAMLGALRVVRR